MPFGSLSWVWRRATALPSPGLISYRVGHWASPSYQPGFRSKPSLTFCLDVWGSLWSFSILRRAAYSTVSSGRSGSGAERALAQVSVLWVVRSMDNPLLVLAGLDSAAGALLVRFWGHSQGIGSGYDIGFLEF